MKELIIKLEPNGNFSMINTGFLIHELVGIGEMIRADGLKTFLSKQPIEEPKTESNE